MLAAMYHVIKSEMTLVAHAFNVCEAQLFGSLLAECAEMVAKSTRGQCNDDSAEPVLGTAYQ